MQSFGQYSFEQFSTYTGSLSGGAKYYTIFNNELYFNAASTPSTSNFELWKTNGTQTGTTQTRATGLFVTTEFLFGARHTNAGTGATDKLNNVNSSLYPIFYQMRVYNKALSGSEITQNYNAIKTTYGI